MNERQTKRYVKVTYQFLLIVAMIVIPPLMAVAGYINAGVRGAVVFALFLFVPMIIAFIGITLADDKGYVEN